MGTQIIGRFLFVWTHPVFQTAKRSVIPKAVGAVRERDREYDTGGLSTKAMFGFANDRGTIKPLRQYGASPPPIKD